MDAFQDLFEVCLESAEERDFGEARLRVTEELRVEFAHRLRARLVGMLVEKSGQALLAHHRTLLGFLYAAQCARVEGLVDDVEWAAFAGTAREDPADPFALGLLEEDAGVAVRGGRGRERGPRGGVRREACPSACGVRTLCNRIVVRRCARGVPFLPSFRGHGP